ncbi:MAG TPA: hypothetical protein VFT43_15710 [Candidatus Polarisedimenticolia bacterium]|nr:hypothetical protein [Candidatus Polarisedimenticolia bacterium]
MQVTLIRRGGWGKADVKEVDFAGDLAILKDFADKSWPVRLLGRHQVVREIRALARLQGIAGIPACYGPDGRHGVLLERIPGERITRWCRRRPAEISRMFEKLVRLVDAVHARGVAHIDLRKRDNILVTEAGEPYLIDFNASCCFDPGTLAARLIFPLLRRIDASAVLKWKARLAPGLLDETDRRRHRRLEWLRRLWIFN